MQTVLNIFAILSGIYTIYSIIKIFFQRPEKEISIIERDCIIYMTKRLKLHQELEIFYNKEKIENNLIFYKATICNSGSKDIDNPSGKYFTLEFPTEYKWRKIDIVDKSNAVEIVDIQLNDSKLNLKFEEFRKNEFIQFDAIIEYKNENLCEANLIKELPQPLSFKLSAEKNRICDLNTKTRDTLLREQSLSAASTAFLFISLITFLIGGFFLFSHSSSEKRQQSIYEIVMDSTKTEIELFKIKDSLVAKEDVKTNISIDTTEKKIYFKNVICSEKEEVPIFHILFRISLISFGVFLFWYIQKVLICIKLRQLHSEYKGMWLPFNYQMRQCGRLA